ncbi:MAG: hypothetical protein U1D69_06480, partial [Polynucleobacter sp.]|nr:hypothetical protein [Polynucleobacter sp.]
HIQGNQRVSSTVERGFKYHFVSRIAQLRTPKIVQMHRLDVLAHCIEKGVGSCDRSIADG